MKLYKISQTDNNDYDTYDSAVVAAETKKEARMTHPSPWRHKNVKDKWDGEDGGYDWTSAKRVTVELIGTAKRGTKAGVIVASFNAG